MLDRLTKENFVDHPPFFTVYDYWYNVLVDYLNGNETLFNTQAIQFDTNYTDGHEEGRLHWNSEDGTLCFGMPGGNVNLQIGQEMLVKVTNKSGADIYNGQIVYPSGAQGSRPTIELYDASISSRAIGICTEDIDNNDSGYVTLLGLVRDIDTHLWAAGTTLYASTVAGGMTSTRPEAPYYQIPVGIVLFSNADSGIVLWNPKFSYTLEELANVHTGTTTTGQFFKWNNATTRWEIRTDWDDLPPVPIIGAKLGATAPTLATFVGTIEQYTFDATNDYVLGSTEITHSWKEGTVIYPHIHWATNGLEANAKGVQWQLKYTIGDGNEAFGGEITSVVDVTIPINTPDRTHLISNFLPTIDGTNLKIGAYIIWRLARIATAHIGGEPLADPFAIAVGFHIEQDTLGSTGIGTK